MAVATSGPESSTGDPDRVGALLPADRDDVVDLVGAVARVTGSLPVIGADAVRDHRTARRALDLAWDQLLSVMSTSPTVTAPAVDLLRRVKEVDDALLRRDIAARDQLFHRVREALAALSDIQSTAALIARVPQLACALGFDRAIISRVEDAVWIPENVVVERDPTWAGEILAIGRENPLTLTAALPESEILRRRVSLVVENVQQRESVHKPIADASLSRSYAASPILTAGDVVGFLHCDCYYQQRDLDETDRQVLATFAEGLGQVLARTMMLDQVGAVRSGLNDIASRLGAPGLAGGPADAFRGLWSGAAPAEQAPAPAPAADSGFGSRTQAASSVGKADLTRRELEVLRHMAAGDTNARTARRLVISEGTVKSHVKHILRKLGAANRAEAVSLWWQMQDRGHRGASA
ncbi:LuxR C-terminal-related transcriptional regulator [Actinomycetospora endophytica]|uniref:LuxR C-terminal-related transcriptional regulator n=1 Tax=Actinomycetospora endophytica TaxID=2291215 RepID=A0ABS8P6K5_9PSEU|nr:LuxR C-terminal-related transcriptional regulator [Actinomycetospora endophytica]MCD2193774.1 LuxR C-terminal-related transcriptional regulator [Actinomycetospora endophytica]